MSLWPPAGTDLWNITAPAIRFGLLRDLRIMNAHAVWMFHGRAYAGGRFVSCIVMLPWVRLEAHPFHIPPRIALLGLSVTITELRGRLGTSSGIGRHANST